MPDSTRPSLPVKHTCLAPASWPFRQNLVHGEKMSCGSAAACCSAGAAGAPLGCGCAAGGALALGAAAFGTGVCASTDGTTNIVVANARTNAQATGRAGATNVRCSMCNPLADRSCSDPAE